MCPGGRQICNSNAHFLLGIIEELSCCKRGFKAKYGLDQVRMIRNDCYQFLLLV